MLHVATTSVVGDDMLSGTLACAHACSDNDNNNNNNNNTNLL